MAESNKPHQDNPLPESTATQPILTISIPNRTSQNCTTPRTQISNNIQKIRQLKLRQLPFSNEELKHAQKLKWMTQQLIKAEMENLISQLKTEQRSNKKLQEELATYKRLEEHLEDFQRLLDYKSKIYELIMKNNESEQVIKELKQELKHKENLTLYLEQKITNLDKLLSTTSAELSELQQIKNAKDTNDVVDVLKERDELRKVNEKLEIELRETMKELARVEDKLKTVEKEKDELIQTKSRLESELSKSKEAHKLMSDTLKKHEEETKQEIDNLQQKISYQNDAIKTLMKTKEKEIMELKKEVKELKTKEEAQSKIIQDMTVAKSQTSMSLRLFVLIGLSVAGCLWYLRVFQPEQLKQLFELLKM